MIILVTVGINVVVGILLAVGVSILGVVGILVTVRARTGGYVCCRVRTLSVGHEHLRIILGEMLISRVTRAISTVK